MTIIMNKKLYIIVFVLILSGLGAGLKAQISQTQYFLGFPQANLANPAFRPSSKHYIGLPGLSNNYVNINNNMLNLPELFQPMAGYDSTITILHPDYDLDAFLNSLGRNGNVTLDASVQALGFGFTISNDLYIDISLSQRVNATANIPADLFTLLFRGNESFIGSSIDLSGLGFKAMQYMESSVGVSKSVNEKLRVGGRVKLLFGGVGMSVDNKRLEIDVNENFSHTIHSDLVVNVSGPVDFYTNDDNMIDSVNIRDDINPFDIILNGKNTGLAFDFGAEYQLLPNLTLSASIVDLGFIGWKTDVFNLRATNDFSFDSFDLTSVIDGDQEFDEMLDTFADSLKNSFELTDAADKFNMGLPTKVFLGAQYKPLDFVGFGILSRTTFNQGHVYQALSLSSNFYLGDVLSSSITYTMASRSYSNLGIGLAVKMGPVQLYTVADQIPFKWTKFTDSSGGGFSLPSRIDYFNLRFGINLLFGKVKQKAVDKPMLLE